MFRDSVTIALMLHLWRIARFCLMDRINMIKNVVEKNLVNF